MIPGFVIAIPDARSAVREKQSRLIGTYLTGISSSPFGLLAMTQLVDMLQAAE
jgi:hypothetical protein